MNTFFESYFSDCDFDRKETAVCCPFPHTTLNGLEYYENNPSAHVNLMKGVFHCKVCNTGYSEVGFIARILGTSYERAVRLAKLFHKTEDLHTWRNKQLSPERKQKANELGISNAVLEELHVATEFEDDLAFPVFMYDKLVDVRTYRPENRENKIRSRTGAISGLVIPFDIWRNTPKNKWTIICAGEKDMAVARSHGFNAITLTGGEKALPAFINPFRNRNIAICYDNDAPGIQGAQALASYLQPYANIVKVVTGFHDICQESGEDITDFFVKYGKQKEDLIKYIKETPIYTAEDAKEERRKRYPLVTLTEAGLSEYLGKTLQANVQVVSTYSETFELPTTIIGTKTSVSSGSTRTNTLQVGAKVTWEYTEKNCKDILKLIDCNLSENTIRENTNILLGLPKNESSVLHEVVTKTTVYKASVADIYSNTDRYAETREYDCYILGESLNSSSKYAITFRLVPHPYKGQANCIIILNAEPIEDDIDKLIITDKVKQHLDKFRNLEGTVPEKMNLLTQMVKNFIGYNGYDQLIQAIDLSYNTVLQFNWDKEKGMRGYLDTLIVTESRIGKSSTANALQNLYELGAFVSLAGANATVAGIVGGSVKTGSTFKTKAGVIPINHKGLIVFEELAKSDAGLLKQLTDIRSSNEVRITRVAGTLTLPAYVRMITLSNTKNSSTRAKPINSYPFGIDILTELVGTPEDIARYDICLVLGETQGQPDDVVFPEAFERETYKTKIRWVWSRKPEQVILSKDLCNYIRSKCKELNATYDSHIKIFGTEAWKKVSRLAVAVACYLVSTDDTYEKIIVRKEHVDWAVDYLISIYDNRTFKLKEFVSSERMYTEIDEDGVALLQDLYIKYTTALLQLERSNVLTKQSMMATTGLDNDGYNKMMQQLVRGLFIRFEEYNIVPTPRFRTGMSMINRNVRINKVGEVDA